MKIYCNKIEVDRNTGKRRATIHIEFNKDEYRQSVEVYKILIRSQLPIELHSSDTEINQGGVDKIYVSCYTIQELLSMVRHIKELYSIAVREFESSAGGELVKKINIILEG